MYLSNEMPVSCPTCGHFVAYSVDRCGTCSTDLTDIDLKALARRQYSRKRRSLLLLAGALALCWWIVYSLSS